MGRKIMNRFLTPNNFSKLDVNGDGPHILGYYPPMNLLTYSHNSQKEKVTKRKRTTATNINLNQKRTHHLLETADISTCQLHTLLNPLKVRHYEGIITHKPIFLHQAQRGIRYAHIEVGHIAQNIHLQAVALGLGSVPIGAFNDGEVKKILSLPINHEPLYIIPVGY